MQFKVAREIDNAATRDLQNFLDAPPGSKDCFDFLWLHPGVLGARFSKKLKKGGRHPVGRENHTSITSILRTLKTESAGIVNF